MNKIIFRVFIFAVALAGVSGASFAESADEKTEGICFAIPADLILEF